MCATFARAALTCRLFFWMWASKLSTTKKTEWLNDHVYRVVMYQNIVCAHRLCWPPPAPLLWSAVCTPHGSWASVTAVPRCAERAGQGRRLGWMRMGVRKMMMLMLMRMLKKAGLRAQVLWLLIGCGVHRGRSEMLHLRNYYIGQRKMRISSIMLKLLREAPLHHN